jgi:5-formyltetrahydrofolate cyclo-ligase
MTHDHALDAAKSALRLEARRRRKALMIEHPEADWMIADRVDQLLTGLKLSPGVAAVYKSLGAEIDPRPLSDALVKRGWRLALPAVVDEAAPLEFRAWTPGERLVNDVAGLPAPLDRAEVLIPTLIFTPLLAYDAAGNRLGQGGGYYDRTLEAMTAQGRRPPFIGLAYRGQQVDEAPHGPLDQRLDGILTEAGYIPCRKDI